MSVAAMAWALKQKAGGPAAKAVLLVLADFADDAGFCWPGQELIAELTEQSVDSVQRQIRDQLVPRGLVECQRRRHPRGGFSSNTYTLAVGMRAKPQSAAKPSSQSGSLRLGKTATVRSSRAALVRPTDEPSSEPLIDPSGGDTQIPTAPARVVQPVGLARKPAAIPQSTGFGGETPKRTFESRKREALAQQQLHNRLADKIGWLEMMELSSAEISQACAQLVAGTLDDRAVAELCAIAKSRGDQVACKPGLTEQSSAMAPRVSLQPAVTSAFTGLATNPVTGSIAEPVGPAPLGGSEADPPKLRSPVNPSPAVPDDRHLIARGADDG